MKSYLFWSENILRRRLDTSSQTLGSPVQQYKFNSAVSKNTFRINFPQSFFKSKHALSTGEFFIWTENPGKYPLVQRLRNHSTVAAISGLYTGAILFFKKSFCISTIRSIAVNNAIVGSTKIKYFQEIYSVNNVLDHGKEKNYSIYFDNISWPVSHAGLDIKEKYLRMNIQCGNRECNGK